LRDESDCDPDRQQVHSGAVIEVAEGEHAQDEGQRAADEQEKATAPGRTGESKRCNDLCDP
jgi:hypothetical protein